MGHSAPRGPLWLAAQTSLVVGAGWGCHGQRLKQDLEVSQVLGPLRSDDSTRVNSCIHPSGAVFTFPRFSINLIFSLLPNMPFWGGILKKQSGECRGSPAIINNGVTNQHDLFITTKLLSTSPHQAFPPYPYMTGWGSVKGFSPSLRHLWGNGATTVVNCVQETVSNGIAQPGDHLLRQKGSSPSCLLADLTVSQVGSSPPSQSSGAGLLGQRSRLVDVVWPWIVHVVPVTQRASAGTLISIWCLPRKQLYDLNLKPSPRRLPSHDFHSASEGSVATGVFPCAPCCDLACYLSQPLSFCPEHSRCSIHIC